MNVVLRAEGVTVRRGTGGQRRAVLQQVECDLHGGEVLMLLGPNGAGKSTLLHTLAGYFAPDCGTVHFAGRPLHEWSARELARQRAVLMQQTAVTLDFTVEEVVRLSGIARGLHAAALDSMMETVLTATELTPLRTRTLPALSGGEQARVHLARTLLQLWPNETEPATARLLLLDEPCANLDPYYQHQVCRIVCNFARRTDAAVVMSMHDMNLAAQYADRVLALVKEQCIAQGNPREVLQKELVYRCFGVGITRLQAKDTLLLATHTARVDQSTAVMSEPTLTSSI